MKDDNMKTLKLSDVQWALLYDKGEAFNFRVLVINAMKKHKFEGFEDYLKKALSSSNVALKLAALKLRVDPNNMKKIKLNINWDKLRRKRLTATEMGVKTRYHISFIVS